MYGFVRVAGYFVLLSTPAALLAAALGRPSSVPVETLGLEGGVVLAGSVAAVVEREELPAPTEAAGFDREEAVDGLAVVAAAVLTYLLSVSAGLGPVIASALVGLVAAVGLPRVAVPAYCGSFVGMASPTVFPSAEYLVVAGGLAAAAFVATKDAFGGFGGKLGTTALFGCATAMLVPGVEYASASGLAWTQSPVVVPVAVGGAVAAFVLNVRLDLGAVLGSALVGLAAGVGFPALLPELGTTLAAVAFCASFVGMSTTDRLGGEVGVALAGGLCGLVFVAVSPAFAGAGGKLGTVAFVSCVAVFGAAELAGLDVHRPTE